MAVLRVENPIVTYKVCQCRFRQHMEFRDEPAPTADLHEPRVWVVHVPEKVEVLSRCEAHAHISDDAELFRVVYHNHDSEQRRRARICAPLEQRGIPVQWELEGEAPGRVLRVRTPRGSLAQAERAAEQSKADFDFGPGKVIIEER